METISVTDSTDTLLEDAVYCDDLAQTAASAYDFPMAIIFYQEAYYGYEAAGAIPATKTTMTRMITLMDAMFR